MHSLQCDFCSGNVCIHQGDSGMTSPILLPCKEKDVRLRELQPYHVSDYFYTKLLAEVLKNSSTSIFFPGNLHFSMIFYYPWLLVFQNKFRGCHPYDLFKSLKTI